MPIEAAPAKLNLALHLRRRREDGYHELETIFAFTDFGDVLQVAAAEALSLTVIGDFAAAAGAGEDNLVLRAARLLAGAAGVPARAALTLDKRIPVAAGLGGGSADAAAALRLLNRYWRLGWPEVRLVELAADLGSDVPACVPSRTCLGTGRGEVLAPWSGVAPGSAVLIANPRVAVPTGPVFAGWDRRDRGGIAAGAALADLRNDMTPAAIAIAPVIGGLLAMLAATDAVHLARMSGSGASCFALYPDSAACAAAARLVESQGWWAAATTIR